MARSPDEKEPEILSFALHAFIAIEATYRTAMDRRDFFFPYYGQRTPTSSGSFCFFWDLGSTPPVWSVASGEQRNLNSPFSRSSPPIAIASTSGDSPKSLCTSAQATLENPLMPFQLLKSPTRSGAKKKKRCLSDFGPKFVKVSQKTFPEKQLFQLDHSTVSRWKRQKLTSQIGLFFDVFTWMYSRLDEIQYSN